MLGTQKVTLPGGQIIRAEVEMNDLDMQKGMMFRDALARGRGMLFIHQTPGLYPYWMYQMKIPLDIIWMDASRRIVEISPEHAGLQDQSQLVRRTMAATRPRNSCWNWAQARRGGWA